MPGSRAGTWRPPAATVMAVTCGTERIDGVSHDAVEASHEITAYKTLTGSL